MKKMKVFLSLALVLCMVLSFAPLRGQSSADWDDWKPTDAWNFRSTANYREGWYYNNGWYYKDGWYEQADRWYQVDFTTVRIPAEVKDGTTVTTGTAKVAGTSTRMVDTSFSYYFNEWARTLIIRGTGDMPKFDKEHPAPWANLKDKVSRVIFERNITSVSAGAFVDFSRLRSVVLPATLKTIDPQAFTWSDEVRQLKTFRKLERLEFSGDLDKLDKILKTCNCKDLLDAKVLKVTEKSIQDEIWQLTWYHIKSPVRIQYDAAGRPIRIIRIDKNGNYFDTRVQYDVTLADSAVWSDSTPTGPEVSTAFERDVIEKRHTYSETASGDQHLYDYEKNDLGQTTYFAAYNLKNGAIVSGTQVFYDDHGVTARGTLASISSTQRVWNNILADGTPEEMTEVFNAAGQVTEVKTVTKDKNGNTLGTSITKNDYKNGRMDSSTTTTTVGTTVTTAGSSDFTYNGNGQLTSYIRTNEDATKTTEIGRAHV